MSDACRPWLTVERIKQSILLAHSNAPIGRGLRGYPRIRLSPPTTRTAGEGGLMGDEARARPIPPGHRKAPPGAGETVSARLPGGHGVAQGAADGEFDSGSVTMYHDQGTSRDQALCRRGVSVSCRPARPESNHPGPRGPPTDIAGTNAANLVPTAQRLYHVPQHGEQPRHAGPRAWPLPGNVA